MVLWVRITYDVVVLLQRLNYSKVIKKWAIYNHKLLTLLHRISCEFFFLEFSIVYSHSMFLRYLFMLLNNNILF